MIELIVKGCCQECEHIDLHLERLTFGVHQIYELHCAHESVCGELQAEARRIVQQDPEEREG